MIEYFKRAKNSESSADPPLIKKKFYDKTLNI